MKRRNFVKNISLASVAAPFVLKDINFQAIQKKLFNVSKSAEDRVLVIIRLNGGNDGLNTVIPLNSYDNLMAHRANVMLPETSILQITPGLGLHPTMTGMRDMFTAGKLSIVQNVGYPEQNRSHFRSMDIWSSGSLDPQETRGWLGRQFDNDYPNYPADYPNATYPDPFAISMGYEVSATCQGLMANFSHAINDPFATSNLLTANVVNDGTYFGSHMEYLATLIDQTNAYGDQINTAANAGSTLSTMYDTNNPIAVQLRYVAQMISGGLKTKVFILNINGFDTHDAQVSATDTTLGSHRDLLKMLSDAVSAFQNDLMLLNLESRVAGMTFSEFGRQIASNGSKGTDHGDAAPMFLFGACINAGVVGPDPMIDAAIDVQVGVPMQIDFRDVYASILKDWFEVPATEVQSIFDHTVNFYQVLGACNVGLEEQEFEKEGVLIFPNPAVSYSTIRLKTENEWVKIEVLDLDGRIVKEVADANMDQGTHYIQFEIGDLMPGQYIVTIKKRSGFKRVKLMKVK
jgi:uncharacterized protein (DUF1501 family)